MPDGGPLSCIVTGHPSPYMTRPVPSVGVLSVALALLAAAPARAQTIVLHPAVTQAAADSARAAIEGLLDTHVREWNRHDIDRWIEAVHDDADWVHWRGGYWRGKAAIKAGHEQIHRTYYRNTVLSPKRIEDMAFLAPDVVLVHVRGEMSGDERSPGNVIPYRTSFIYTRKDGVWKVRAVHNTRLDGVQ